MFFHSWVVAFLTFRSRIMSPEHCVLSLLIILLVFALILTLFATSCLRVTRLSIAWAVFVGEVLAGCHFPDAGACQQASPLELLEGTETEQPSIHPIYTVLGCFDTTHQLMRFSPATTKWQLNYLFTMQP